MLSFHFVREELLPDTSSFCAPNLTIHFQTKNLSIAIIILNLLLFAPIVSQQFVNPFESLTLRFWYIGRTKSGKIWSGSLLELPPDCLSQV